MATPDVPEIRRLLHTLREPLGAFVIHLELLEGEQITTAAQSYVKTMCGHMDRARAALDEIEFRLENGHAPSAPRRSSP